MSIKSNFHINFQLCYTWALCIWSSSMLIGAYIRAYFGWVHYDIFDASLRSLATHYASHHFVPYTTFGVVYPPGLLILSELFDLSWDRRHIVFTTLHVFSSIPLLIYCAKRSGPVVFFSLCLLLTVTLVFTSYDPLVEVCWYICIVSALHSPHTRTSHLLHGFFFGAVFLLKWERALALLCISMCIWVIQRKHVGRIYMQLVALGLSGCLAIAYILYHGTTLSDAWHFIYQIPLQILPARRIIPPQFPFLSPSQWFQLDYLLHITLFFLVIYTILAIKKLQKSKDTSHLFLLLCTWSLVPYASVVAHPDHALPLFLTLTLAVGYTACNGRFAILRTTILTYLILQCIFQPHRFSLANPLYTSYTQRVKQSLANCSLTVSNLSYKSMFVGRETYDWYLYSHAMLYLISPNTPPATRYISDEPGLQNTCKDGARLAQDLTQSYKPILAFIDQSPRSHPFAEFTHKNCKKVEEWLQQRPYSPIGACTHENVKFDIRLYH